MINMLKSLWSMLTVWISVGEDFAQAAKHISTYTKEGAEVFTEEARIERKASIEELRKKYETSSLPAPAKE